MSVIAYTVLFIYTFALVYISIYCVLQFHLLFYYKKHHAGDKTLLPELKSDQELPFVTIQLPIYNELYVVERLIDNITQFDYPKDRFEIHILDDSTDETVDIAQKKVAEYQAKGYNIEWIHRVDRQGYKAGALKEGMHRAKGEFIAIFDADFLPHHNFLKKTIPHFQDERVGVVQTKWEHINQDYSLLTRLQAMQLNVHFTIEQQGRKAGNFMLQFNGTAGVWRKETIEDAGGWEADTLTEDLDLSYRAQLKGWKISYLEHLGSPAELPAEMNGLKSQQFRWMKGGAETARKMLPTVWNSQLSLSKKLHATGHLLASSVFLFVFIAGVFSVPLVFTLDVIDFNPDIFAVFLVGWLSLILVYYVANIEAAPGIKPNAKTLFKFIFIFPIFLALSMGLSLHNTIAVIQGYIGKKSPFIRTPKFNIKNIKDSFQKRQYLARKIPWTTFMEGILSLYFLGGVLGGLYLQNNTFIAFHSLLMIGYGTICFYSIRHVKA